MTTLLISSLILAGALVIQGAAVPATETALRQAKFADAAGYVNKAAAFRQAGFSFCLDGWSSFRGNCYFLGNHADSWANAESFCSSFGANLASVHSIWEYNFLQRLLKTGGHSFGWIGGYYFEGAWRWEDGSTVNYENWGKVDNPEYYQCLQMDSQVGQGWTSNDCSTPFPFVCQANPNC